VCNASNAHWRGGNPNYPFCVKQDMEWTDGGNPVRFFASRQDIMLGVHWNIYGISGLWVLIEPNGDKCAAGSTIRKAPVSGEGTYSWNVRDFENGGYKISMLVRRNDGVEVRHNEKYMCIGMNTYPVPTDTVWPTITPRPTNPPAPTMTPGIPMPTNTSVPVATDISSPPIDTPVPPTNTPYPPVPTVPLPTAVP
jgi:hypothetical protein